MGIIVALHGPREVSKMAGAGWGSLTPRVRIARDVVAVCAWPRAPGFRIGVRKDGRGRS